MSSAEAFIREFLAQRNRYIHEISLARVPLRKRFFASDCPLWNDAHAAREMANYEAESVLGVTTQVDSAEVTTTGAFGGHFRARYHLQRSSDDWLISRVQFECSLCHGTGKRKHGSGDCSFCGGHGWHTMGESNSDSS
jgi:hypothetical protein